MIRRTKIVTTLGPATDNEEALTDLFKAGANVVRMNFSHGTADDHINRAKMVRKVAADLDLNIAILGDLQGPKIRIAKFKNNKVIINQGDSFILDADLDKTAGDENQVGIDYKELPKDCKIGDELLLDDGRIELEIKNIDGNKVITEVIIGGEISNNKGINLRGGGLSASALTNKDMEDIKTAAKIGVDYLAVSFPRTAEDIRFAKKLTRAAGSEAGMVAKIERAETVSDDNLLDEIIQASAAVMVARGDLGVEIGDAELIGVQKKIIQRARAQDRAVITATQMMESMITNAIPTRAEVFDVANAVLDGTDAVMLSAETATGEHPIRVVEAMSRVCLGAEKQKSTQISGHRVELQWKNIDETIAMASMYAANHLPDIKAIVCLTESGSTPLLMSRIRSGMPIYALTRLESTKRRMALFRGVEAISFDPTVLARHDVNRLAADELMKRGVVKEGDLILLTKGDHMGILGGTNALKILKIGEIV
ncbi:pyruvate kinase [Aliikangiella coralliicola]|uniref:Pyruvate kinase n=1 Tax=Aliikangiella coralliicola TaxID=2592383 RepID=A0A545U8J6_9GAMM|nr:pyruvate kinase [Aliikangiella coralliicola]TQV85796.1 pyruvate kinase [Aliikangiella coralliicola]